MIGATLLSLVIVGTLGGFFVGWTLAIAYRLYSGRPTPLAPQEGERWSLRDIVREGMHRLRTGRFLPWTPRRHVPWKWFDMAVVALPVLALILLPLVFVDPGKKANVPLKLEQFRAIVITDVNVKLAYLLLATVYLVVRAGARAHDFGFSWRGLGQNAAIGILAFPMIAVPVYALQAALVLSGWAYEHPLIEMLQKSPDFSLYLVLVLSACVVAPLSEEWFFRVIFQGWLERACAWTKRPLNAVGPAATETLPALPAVVVEAGPLEHAELQIPPTADLNPYAAPPSSPPLAPEPLVDEACEEPVHFVLVHWVPIVCSSVLFGLAHFGHGPAPITLTVLALALGYLYQRTHSIVPVIVVHAMFNSVSMLLFYVTMFERSLPMP